jgi:hypothetical protein
MNIYPPSSFSSAPFSTPTVTRTITVSCYDGNKDGVTGLPWDNSTADSGAGVQSWIFPFRGMERARLLFRDGAGRYEEVDRKARSYSDDGQWKSDIRDNTDSSSQH